MERQPAAKRRRIYSVEASEEIGEAAFARRYVWSLVPALMKLKKQHQKEKEKEKSFNNIIYNNNNNNIINIVKHEVGMAMVCSAPPGFAWTNAFKSNLILANDDQNAPSSPLVSSSSSNPTINNIDDDLGMEDINEEDEFRRLRRLIPGGEEMDDEEEMVKELVSYIGCLQMQVNILQCLTHHYTS